MSATDDLDPRVAERMGYPNALRATSFDDRGRPIEIALIGPREPGGEYAVTIHYNCDPDREDQGTSELHGHATLEAAERDYEAEVAQIASEIRTSPSP